MDRNLKMVRGDTFAFGIEYEFDDKSKEDLDTCYFSCKLCHVDELITGVCVLLSAMPAGMGTALLASKYGCNEEFATKTVVFSTVMSLVTTPIWSYILLMGV